MKRIGGFLVINLLGVALACGPQKNSKEKPIDLKVVTVPVFNSDSAYHFVEKQVGFGPRVPNTRAHRDASDYFVQQFKKYGASITVQDFEATTFDNQRLQLKNIIASYFPQAQKRIMLAAHWDTRPFADKDKKKKDAPFAGANDGASGVGVLLEVARSLGQSAPASVGIDIILFDGEDWGEKEGMAVVELPEGQGSWWCLGSQYWSRNKHKKNYKAEYGILLDMVGAKKSQFFREEVSLEYASQIMEKVWTRAAQIGYSDYFVNQKVGGITDDHVFLNQWAKIPFIVIVHYQSGIGFFGDYHHSTKDNMSLISKETLAAVGNTLLNVVYHEE
jgi:glutaminyl-peptide cyclotransferase